MKRQGRSKHEILWGWREEAGPVVLARPA